MKDCFLVTAHHIEYDTLVPDEFKEIYTLKSFNALCLSTDTDLSKIKNDLDKMKEFAVKCLKDHQKKYGV